LCIMVILHYLGITFSHTFRTILIFLPIIVSCCFIELFSTFANRRFAGKFGMCGILPFAIIGTPIHELSHAIVAFLTGHRIEELALFRPNPLTGELGHLKHSWNDRNPFQKFIGNPLIAIAPFFGGALILYFLTKLLMPQLIIGNTLPALSSNLLGDFYQFETYIVTLFDGTVSMLRMFFKWRNLLSIKFYIYVLLVLGISLHLAPSRQDFVHFWTYLFGLLVIIFSINLIFPHFSVFLEFHFVGFLLKLHPLLSLAAFFSLVSALIAGLLL